jgi:hypothetical protein
MQIHSLNVHGTMAGGGGGLLARPALRVLQLALPDFGLFALRLADVERAAAQIFGFIKLVVGQSILSGEIGFEDPL